MVAEKPQKPRLAVELNVKTGDELFVVGKGTVRFEMPRHVRIKRRRRKTRQ